MGKINCWEHKKCGREVGGAKERELGGCPAATNFTYKGTNDGKSAGRYCWKVAGTLCGGSVQGSFVEKMKSCVKCDFFALVKTAEGVTFLA